MFCELCQNDAEKFCRQSHSMPEFMYKPVYSQPKHQVAAVNIDAQTVDTLQKGERYEIICKPCELRSGKYDRYAANLLATVAKGCPSEMGVAVEKYPGPGGGGEFWCGVRFDYFQKFVFGIVLSEHLARKKDGVNILGDKHFAGIRRIYEGETVFDERSYPIWIFRYTDKQLPPERVLVPPMMGRMNGHRTIGFVGAGYEFLTIISSHPKDEFMQFASLNSNGRAMIQYSEYFKTRYFRESLPKLIATLKINNRKL